MDLVDEASRLHREALEEMIKANTNARQETLKFAEDARHYAKKCHELAEVSMTNAENSRKRDFQLMIFAVAIALVAVAALARSF